MSRTPRSLVVAALVAAATCALVPAGAGPAGAASPKCPVKALDKADGPVEIVMWHSMPRASEETLQALTDQFNASQGDVRVKLLNTTSYNDTFTKYRAGLSSGELPDVVQIQDTSLQGMIDSRSAVPIGACVKACLLYTSPSPRDGLLSRMPSSA